MDIIHLKHHEIDFRRWDETVASAMNTLPYAFSWYLDAVSPQWEALIFADYSYVMPLPVKRKYGVKYVIQPRWTQQLGVFSVQPVSSDTIRAFLRKIPYLSYDFNLNFGNVFGRPLPNGIISLQQSYDEMFRHFSQNTRRNIAKAARNGLQIQSVDYQVLVDFWRSENGDKPHELADKLSPLCAAAAEHRVGHFYGVYTADNELVATLMTLETAQRIVYLVPTSNRRGRALCAMFFLVNELLKQHAGTARLFDCEGSCIPGVARFYAGFGAQSQSYFTVNRCRPQWLVKLLNKRGV